MTREEALDELAKPPYPVEQQKEDEEYILKKLEIDPAEWQKILDAPPTPDSAYFSQMGLLRLAQKILGKNKLENIRKKQQSGK